MRFSNVKNICTFCFILCILEKIVHANKLDLKCEEITIPTCRGLPYNMTMFPNIFGMQTQEEAAVEANQFFPLIRVNCSPTLQLFLCVMYLPVCNILQKPLKPCRSLCEQNRQGCEPLMKKFGFYWPDKMRCEQFLTSREDQLCIKENISEKEEPVTTRFPSISPQDLPVVSCPRQLIVPKSAEYQIQAFDKSILNCGIPCNDYFFSSPKKKRFARLWIGLWSIIGAVSTLFTVLTFLIDMGRFRYPERPIIFLSACYFMISMVYVIGFALEDRVACTSYESDAKGPDGTEPLRVVTQGTRRVEGCTILFMLLYFFTMASCIWWVILCLTWFLAAAFHWAHEAIAQNSQYFHFVAWAIPAAKTICLLAFGKVDGDPLSGVCYTGFSNVTFMRVFLIAPQCIYLALGMGFLIAGFVALLRIRTLMKNEGGKTDRFEILCLRIGIFSVLYIVPAFVVIGCLVYESSQQANWTGALLARAGLQDLSSLGGINLAADPVAAAVVNTLSTLADEPIFEVFMIKYLMSLIVGITCSFWVWSGKTVTSWSNCLSGRRGIRGVPASTNNGVSTTGGVTMPVRYTRGQPGSMMDGSAVISSPPGILFNGGTGTGTGTGTSTGHHYQQVYDWSKSPAGTSMGTVGQQMDVM